jgi:WD40 repeat protein
MRRLLAIALLLLAPAVLGASEGSAAKPASAPRARIPRILYASDWSGHMEIYAVDPSAKAPAGQLTFGTAPDCDAAGHALLGGGPLPGGYVDPLPSPDGRYLLYRCANESSPPGSLPSLWVARADGRVLRRFSTAAFAGAAWSPDSNRIAYGGPDGLRVVRADGSGGRLLAPGSFASVAWSPDGKALAALGGNGSDLYLLRSGHARVLRRNAGLDLVWSPDGRWIATWYHNSASEVTLSSPSGRSGPHVGAGVMAAWSPVSRRLAVEGPAGLRVLDLRTDRARLVTRDTAYRTRDYDERSLGLAWAPDGRSIAYVIGSLDPDDGAQSGDLRVVTLAGRERTIVASGRRDGGRIVSLAWTRPPAGIRYRNPEPGPATRIAPDDLLAGGPIERLAADGRRVAFVACLGVYAWAPGTREVTATSGSGPPSSCRLQTNTGIYSLALAQDRVAYGERAGCNSITLTLRLEQLAPPRTSSELARAYGNCGAPYHPAVGDLVGAGDLLVFSTWQEKEDQSQPTIRYLTTAQEIDRVEPGGCPCPAIASSPGPYLPADVDGGRVVAYGANETRVLNRDGKQLLSIPVSPLAAQLSGSDLVLVLQGQLRDYDVATGELRHSWPLADVPSGAECDLRCGGPYRLVLEDAERGLVAYLLDGRVHLLRLRDGADTVVAAAQLARFMDTGLVYADGSRLHLVPFDRLPFR